MVHTIDDAVRYVSILIRHIPKGDIPAAILALLAEPEFRAHMDGFGQLRKSISMRTANSDLYLMEIYIEIIRICNLKMNTAQIHRECVEKQK